MFCRKIDFEYFSGVQNVEIAKILRKKVGKINNVNNYYINYSNDKQPLEN